MKPSKLNKGDKVAIVSLSTGLLGMPFIKHELDLSIKRLKEYGLEPVIMDNSLKGIDYLKEHPEARAADLKQAFMDNSIKGIICAIGGDDTYRTFPYLMEDEEFINAVKNNPKLFTGFSDSTNNHLMLNKLGLSTFYGPALLTDLAELDTEMLPYTKEGFERYFEDGLPFELKSSPVWYLDRESYGEEELGKPRISKPEEHGYELLNGSGIKKGKLYGGCIESIYEAINGNAKEVYEKYHILPTTQEWQEKILFIEPSDQLIKPEELENILNVFKELKILENVKGVLFGKPMNETYYEEYKEVIKKVFNNLETPVLYNLNFGHSVPRYIIPYDASVTVDYDNLKVNIDSNIFGE